MSRQSRAGGPPQTPRWRTYRRPVADEVEREGHGRDGRPLPSDRPAVVPSRPRPRLGRRQLAALAAAAAAIATGGVVYGTTAGEQAPEPYPREEQQEPILTRPGLAAVAAALEARTGSTQVIDAWFEGDDEIRLSTPPVEPDDLADVWRWDGTTLEKWSAEKPDDSPPFDLTALDPAALVRLDEEARDRSDGDISRSLAHVERPVADHEHWIYLKVTEVDHGGVTLWGGLAGDVEAELVNESWRDD